MATILCPNCGAELPENKKFCTECGKKLTAAQQPDAIALQETQKFELPKENKDLEQAVKAVFQKDEDEPKKSKRDKRKEKLEKQKQEKEDAQQQTIVDFSSLAGSTLDDSPYEPISAWGYIGILVLMAIPVIGWIFAIVWACGGCRKINKRNLARGFLLMLALVGIFCACAILAVYKIAPALTDNTAKLQAEATKPVYTVEGVKPTEEGQPADVAYEEGEDSLITYLGDVGDTIWNAYYDRTLPGGEELTAILDGDRDTLIGMGYSEASVDQVLNLVNQDWEALSSLLNSIQAQKETAE